MPPTNKTSVIESFKKKINTYDKDGGFIVYVEGYDNQDLDVEKIADFLSTSLDSLIATLEAGVEAEKVEDGEAMFANDPKNELSEGYTIGYNQALSDVLAIINNAKK